MGETDRMLRGDARVIVVLDDDAAIRKVMRRILERHDFRVVEAEDAQGALEVVESLADPVALLICDLVLPGLDGREAANAVLARFPDIPVLFTSGYSSFSSGRKDVEGAGHPFLPKPFDIPTFLRTVSDALGD